MRAARLAGALRTRCKLDRGDRVAIVAKNCVADLEALYGIWYAGLAGVLVNAKLHGAEIGAPGGGSFPFPKSGKLGEPSFSICNTSKPRQ